GGVVPAILEAGEPGDKDVLAGPRAHVSDDSAHSVKNKCELLRGIRTKTDAGAPVDLAEHCAPDPSRRQVEPGPSAEPGHTGGIDDGWRNEPHLRIHPGPFDPDVPIVVVDAMVTRGAQQHAVVQIGPACISLPPSDVVSFRHSRRQSAHRAAAVAL